MKKVYFYSAACIAGGIALCALSGLLASDTSGISEGELERNPVGGGDRVYEFLAEGIGEDALDISVTVPERVLTKEEFYASVDDAMELVFERIKGDNVSLSDVTGDLDLVGSIPEYGMKVEWESLTPDIISDTGMLTGKELPPEGEKAELRCRLISGENFTDVWFDVTVKNAVISAAESFIEMIGALVLKDRSENTVRLPSEFYGDTITYRSTEKSDGWVFILLGITAAVCLPLQKKNAADKAKKDREDAMLLDYPEIVSRFLVLSGAGYPLKAAWKKQVEDARSSKIKGYHPVYDEMEVTLNQMDSGTPEAGAYEMFGRRIGLPCYIKFSSLLVSSLDTGGRTLRTLLESEMEEAFRQRKDIAARKGEEISTKLLLPMFMMLGVVMALVVTPAFLTMM